MAHKNPRSFLFRLSFLITFLCIFRLAAACGFVVAWRTRAVFRSLRSPSTLCRIWLYTLANLVVPTLDCTRSCSSMAVVLSSSVVSISDTSSSEVGKKSYPFANRGSYRLPSICIRVSGCERGIALVGLRPYAKPYKQTNEVRPEVVETN